MDAGQLSCIPGSRNNGHHCGSFTGLDGESEDAQGVPPLAAAGAAFRATLEKAPPMRTVQTLSGVLLVGLGSLLALAFYDRYWKWRDCFNELGRCFDPITQDVYLQQSGGVYGGLAALFLILGLALLLWAQRHGHKR
jgi:hypothetical protein